MLPVMQPPYLDPGINSTLIFDGSILQWSPLALFYITFGIASLRNTAFVLVNRWLPVGYSWLTVDHT